MYNTRIALIALLILQCLHSHAQKYSWYGAVTDSNRQVIYYTNFDKVDENNKDWETVQSKETHDSLVYAYIKDGILEVTNNTAKGTYATAFPFMFDYTKDFEVEFRVRLAAQYTGWGSLVYWGRDSVNEQPNGQCLYFYPSSAYSMAYCNGANTEPCNYEKIRHVGRPKKEAGRFNTYTVRKIKDSYYVFVNNEYSHKYSYTPLYGQTLGFGTGRKSVANLDYIQVSYLLLD